MTHLIKFQYYSLILDTINTKLSKPEQTKQEKTKQKKKRKEKKTKHTCTIKFDNKALELIQLPQISNLPEVVFQLLLLTNLVKQLEIKFQITEKVSIPLMLMRMYLFVTVLINVTC